jgi:hypothetical protein
MSRLPIAAAVALLLAIPVQGAASGLPVRAVDATTFDVLYRGEASDHDFWCAAGNYAARKLGAKSATRVYRISEPPRRAGQGIRFSLDPAAKASRTGLNTIGSDDGSLSVASAINECEVARQMKQRR